MTDIHQSLTTLQNFLTIFYRFDLIAGSSLEVALVGTALPVLMKLTPQSRYDFGECPVGEHVDSLCTLSNTSTDIPINFNFRRVAHFTARPTSGKIKPGDSQDIIFSFTPNQVGEWPVNFLYLALLCYRSISICCSIRYLALY